MPYILNILINLALQSALIIYFSKRVQSGEVSFEQISRKVKALLWVVGIVIGVLGLPLLIKINQYFHWNMNLGHQADKMASMTMLINFINTFANVYFVRHYIKKQHNKDLE